MEFGGAQQRKGMLRRLLLDKFVDFCLVGELLGQDGDREYWDAMTVCSRTVRNNCFVGCGSMCRGVMFYHI